MKLKMLAPAPVLCLWLVLSCGKSVTPPSSGGNITSLENLSTATGNFRLIATDAPFSYGKVSSAKVTVNRIEVKSSADVSTSLIPQPLVLDLVKLTNGLVTPIVDLDLPPGEYKELNLIIDTGSIDLVSGEHYNLKIPSGTTSELKIKIDPPIVVSTKVSTDIILDFDLARSFIPTGDSKDASTINGFNFRPRLRAANRTTAGTVSGRVLSDQGTPSTGDDSALSGAVVTVSQNDVDVSSAVCDSQGSFKIIGLPAGTYALKVSAFGFTSSLPVPVSITAGNVTSAGETLLNQETMVSSAPAP